MPEPLKEGPTLVQFPRVENKVNWSTLFAAAGLLLTVGGMIYAYGQFTARVDGLDAGVKASTARTEARLDGLETSARSVENLGYRVTIIEQSNANTLAILNELRTALSEQNADIRVIRDTLSRLDGRPAP